MAIHRGSTKLLDDCASVVSGKSAKQFLSVQPNKRTKKKDLNLFLYVFRLCCNQYIANYKRIAKEET